MNKLAVVLVRGTHDVKFEIVDTLKMLNLFRKNTCTIVEANPSNKGMLSKVKDYVTYGEIDDATLKLLLEKRAEPSSEDPKKTKPYFRLNNPKKGFGRKGIKWPFSKSGAIGYRGDKINDLLRRMI